MVVGAGAWGLAGACAAAAAGMGVELIDDGMPAAAWVAAGMLGAWSESEDGRPGLNALLARSAAAWPGFADRLAAAGGADAGFARTGTVLVAARPEHLGDVRHLLSRPIPPRRSFLGASRLRELEPGLGTRIAGGADLADEHQVDPRRMLEALRAVARARGVRVTRGTVAAVDRTGATLASGARRAAGRVLVTAGWAAGRLGDIPVRPVKGQILRLRVAPGQSMPIRRVVRTPDAYLVPRADGELVLGATTEESGDRRVDAGAVHRLLDDGLRAVPGLRDMELVEASAGLRPSAHDGMPVIGEDASGVLWATGGGRHGVLMAPSAAEAVAHLLAHGETPAWAAPFAPGRFGREEAACASS